jgi:hypothetical protein
MIWGMGIWIGNGRREAGGRLNLVHTKWALEERRKAIYGEEGGKRINRCGNIQYTIE